MVLDESLLSVSKIDRFVAADCDNAGLDLGLVVAFMAKSSIGITDSRRSCTLVLRVAPESVFESNPGIDDDD
jgi:hypothetical protein